MRILLIFLVVITQFASSQVRINEVCATNADIIYDPDFYNFSSWVELHNTGSAPVDVSGYFLSDDANHPFKWQIPSGATIASKGFLLIWCDEKWIGLHTGFSLDTDGETLVLTNTSGVVVDNISYPPQFTNMSYARLTEGNTNWRITPTPTPRTANVPGPTGSRLDPPAFSKQGGRYPGSVSIQLYHKDNAEIRYTTDGSEPKANSQKYTSTIALSTTKVVKAMAFHSNFLPSETVSNTYLINEHGSTLPVVSISTNPSYLFDNIIGIYTEGINGIPGTCNSSPMNWNQDWERHAWFEYFDVSGSALVQQAVDIRIGGACSRNYPQKSLVIQPRKKFGSNEIQYPFFSTKKKVNEFGGLFLRNSGNDFNKTMFRDAMIQSLGIGQMNLDYMAYQPTVFYLNGEYWGIQNLREKIDGDFIQSNYGIDKSDIDLLETYENAIEGSASAWQTYKKTLEFLNPTDPNTFNFIDSHIDVAEYINYLITQIYVCNTDWPGNNVKFWRQRSTNGKFRWILWDTDFGFGRYDSFSYPTHLTLNFVTDPNQTTWPNSAFSTLHIRLVLANPEFRNRFIATFATALGTTFHPDRVNQLISEFASRIQNEVPYHKIRWGGNLSDWNYEVQGLRDFSASRSVFMKSHLPNFFGLGSPVQFSVSTTPSASGKVDMNGILIEEMNEIPFYKGIPYRAEAKANAGFRFTEWTVTNRESEFISLADAGSSWKYFDQGASPGPTWITPGFNDTGWAQGNAKLGYGVGDETTLVSYGPDANNKYITTYFRTSFTISDLTNLTDINASVLFDDGVVVYLNGNEIYRNNLPTGTISNNTLAVLAIPQKTPSEFTISKSLLNVGSNTFAVEVHQSSATTSDMSFDLNASTVRLGEQVTYNTSDIELYDTAFANVVMVANFEPIPSIDGLVLNEFSTNKSFAKDSNGEPEDWIELFNSSTQSIDISGVLITDDLAFKDKHTLSNGEAPWLLQSGAYQILWADNQLNQGKDHLSFKLSGEGEQIGMYHVAGYDTMVIAALDFGSQPDGFSMARIPNATGPFVLTSTITPGLVNRAGEIRNLIYPNPADQMLNVLVSSEPIQLYIFDLMGKRVREYSLAPPQEVALDISNLSTGVYVVKVISLSTSYTTRLMVVHP